MNGLIIAAPGSGSGKTTITLGLLKAFSQKGTAIRGAKSGPDYIDPKFHEAACGATCFNLDAWAMTEDRIKSLTAGREMLLIEGAMGLFDGAPPDGAGATADLARILKLPVVLVVDASHMAHSVAPLVNGFSRHDPDVNVAGIILNKIGSPRHEAMLRRALDLPVLGAIHRDASLDTPSRHLGLVPAGERSDLDAFLDAVAETVRKSVDLEAIMTFAKPLPGNTEVADIPAPTKRLAVANDAAFTFAYPHLLKDFKKRGFEISVFSPLRNEPVPDADLVFLPGGYPELHASSLADAKTFLNSLRNAAQTSDIYGECGGYMVLGESLTDAEGITHEMAGLLPLQTSFAQRKLHLGYRNLSALHGPFLGDTKGHEFHYATTLKADGEPLFDATDAEGNPLPSMGLRQGRVCGSFAHVIDRVLP